MTGEKMGDAYFTKLYNLRNEAAKVKRNAGNSSNEQKPMASNGGCESVSNDTRNAQAKEDSCESIVNDSTAAA